MRGSEVYEYRENLRAFLRDLEEADRTHDDE